MTKMPRDIWALPQMPEDDGPLWQRCNFWGGEQYTHTEQLIQEIEGMKEEVSQDPLLRKLDIGYNAALDAVIKILRRSDEANQKHNHIQRRQYQD